MKFIEIPTEQTTAATDLVMALIAAYCGRVLRKFRSVDSFKVGVWTWTFALVAIASGLGAVAHGFIMSQATNDLIWQPLNLSLGLAVGLFGVGAIHDAWGQRISRGALIPMICIGVLFYGATQVLSGGFLLFVIYEGIAMIGALTIYVLLTVRGELQGAALMSWGIVANIVAAAIQATGLVHFTLIWEFDHNGVFHLVQMIGIILLTKGLIAALNDGRK